MNKQKKNIGITLIALIITIIVLLILAGITINMVLGENGLFNKAKTSVAKHENAQEKENSALVGYETEIDNISRDTLTISQEEYNRLKAINTYTPNETEIGIWKDGKTLYQKDLYFTENFDRYDISNINYDYIEIDWSASIINLSYTENNRLYTTSNFYRFEDDYLDVRIRNTEKNLLLSYGSKYSFSDAYIRLKYTKKDNNT